LSNNGADSIAATHKAAVLVGGRVVGIDRVVDRLPMDEVAIR